MKFFYPKWRRLINRKLPDMGTDLYFSEKYIRDDVDGSANKSRKFLEYMIDKVFKYEGINEEKIQSIQHSNYTEEKRKEDLNNFKNENLSLFNKIKILDYSRIIDKIYLKKMHTIRTGGNTGSHTRGFVASKVAKDLYEDSCALGEWFVDTYKEDINKESAMNLIPIHIRDCIKFLSVILVLVLISYIFILTQKSYKEDINKKIQIIELKDKKISKLNEEITELNTKQANEEKFVTNESLVLNSIEVNKNSFEWHEIRGNWNINNGIYMSKGDNDRGADIRSKDRLIDVLVEADIKFSENGNAGILFRSDQTADNCYYIMLQDAPGTELLLGKFDPKWNVITTTTANIDKNKSNKLKVVVRGSNIQAFVGDMSTPLIDIVDTSFTSGYVGLRTWNDNATFSNVKVTELN